MTPTPTPTVYVVDDDPAILRAVTELIELIQLEAKSYTSAREFLQSYQPNGPACLILDVRMPGMSGLELQRELSKSADSPPVIMITGHGDVRMAVEAMAAGALTFLEKPFRTQELCDEIQKAIRRDQKRWRRREQRQDVDSRLETLTSAERDVMELIVAGKTNKMIADQLNLSVRAIEDRRARMMKKLEVASRVELMELVPAVHVG